MPVWVRVQPHHFATTCWMMEACVFTEIARNSFAIPGSSSAAGSRIGSSKHELHARHFADTHANLSALLFAQRVNPRLLALLQTFASWPTCEIELEEYTVEYINKACLADSVNDMLKGGLRFDYVLTWQKKCCRGSTGILFHVHCISGVMEWLGTHIFFGHDVNEISSIGIFQWHLELLTLFKMPHDLNLNVSVVVMILLQQSI